MIAANSHRCRILHLLPALRGGGMERGLIDLLRAMRAEPELAHCEHTVVTLAPADERLARQCTLSAQTIAPASPLSRRESHAFLRRIVRDQQPDILHARSTGVWLDAARCDLRRGQTKLVLGFHGRETLEPPGLIARTKLRLALARAWAVVALSGESADWLRSTFRVAPQRLHVIHNGVDTLRFHPGSNENRQATRRAVLAHCDRQMVLCVANLLPIKALDVLAAAWRRVAMVVPQARLLIAGEGPQRDSLERMLETARVADRLTLLGERDDVPALLRAADLFVLPSRYECCSNGLLQAMASGLPCIATAVGGNLELIEPQRTGWLVPPDSPAALAEMMISALMHADVRARVGHAAREHVLANHRLESAAAAYGALYATLMSPPADPRPIPRELVACAE